MAKEFRATVLERAIGRALGEWRRDREFSLSEAGRRVGFSTAKLSMMENALQPSTPVDVLALGFVYQVASPERQQLVTNSEHARQLRTTGEAKVLFDAVGEYCRLEVEANALRAFRIDVVPVFLQIPDYITALALADDPVRGSVIAEQQIAMRDGRRQRLRGKNPPKVEVVLCEAAVRQLVGGPQVMRAQLLHLMELAELPNVTIQLIPFDAGAYPAHGSPFTILSFPHEQHDDVVYLQSVQRGSYVERPEEREPYTLRFAALQAVALSPGESLELIAEVLSSM
ncbi:transcriptional regulator [Lentzea sp. NBRC 105346]|uniref:helix-turn-helix domain-containing protein n=1 Tax=Lentzea sp. NBRC 105346 TaxID=3032205 RepID=UPI0024A60087|nr:helix-turn-helix transcriptional regulator [Lentzea sp. NBRC 105346]GLZ33460.1 transcriptional regulator [Lentzea sp. NBRC 105346]